MSYLTFTTTYKLIITFAKYWSYISAPMYDIIFEAYKKPDTFIFCTIFTFAEHCAMVQAFWQTSTSSSSNGGKYSSSRATLRQHTFFYFYFFFLMLERERFSKRRGIGFWYICVTRESSLILPKKYLSIEWSCWSQANFSARKTFQYSGF